MRRRTKQIAKTPKPPRLLLKTHDSEESNCELIGTVRHHSIALRVQGGTEWAHMTPDEACQLIAFLEHALVEVWERIGPGKCDLL